MAENALAERCGVAFLELDLQKVETPPLPSPWLLLLQETRCCGGARARCQLQLGECCFHRYRVLFVVRAERHSVRLSKGHMCIAKKEHFWARSITVTKDILPLAVLLCAVSVCARVE